MMRTWRVWSLDMWGNPEDGWQFNDRRELGFVEMPDDGVEDATVLAVLADTLGLRMRVPTHVEEWDWHGEGQISIDVENAETGEPLLTLETVT